MGWNVVRIGLPLRQIVTACVRIFEAEEFAEIGHGDDFLAEQSPPVKTVIAVGQKRAARAEEFNRLAETLLGISLIFTIDIAETWDIFKSVAELVRFLSMKESDVVILFFEFTIEGWMHAAHARDPFELGRIIASSDEGEFRGIWRIAIFALFLQPFFKSGNAIVSRAPNNNASAPRSESGKEFERASMNVMAFEFDQTAAAKDGCFTFEQLERVLRAVCINIFPEMMIVNLRTGLASEKIEIFVRAAFEITDIGRDRMKENITRARNRLSQVAEIKFPAQGQLAEVLFYRAFQMKRHGIISRSARS